MTDAIRAAIAASREREKRFRKQASDSDNSLYSHGVAKLESCAAEFRFRDAFELLLDEVTALMPPKCECTPKWICPHCLLKSTIEKCAAILEGRAGGGDV